LNIAFASTSDLYNMLTSIKTWFRNVYPMLELGKELPEMPSWLFKLWKLKLPLSIQW
jgi:hypothetical protein